MEPGVKLPHQAVVALDACGEFIERVVPLTAGDREAAFQFLRRTCVRTIGEPELIRRVELRIRSELRTTSGDQLDPRMTRLLLGDIVTAIDEKSIEDPRDVMSFLDSDAPGRRLAVDVLRAGQPARVEVIVGEKE